MHSHKTITAVKSISLAAIVAALGISGAQAQSLRSADEPAEFPPASFTALQYVDSRGCVYVRAGRGDAVNWVPRVSRSREVLCGFKPSLQTKVAELPVIKDPTAPASAPAKPATVSGVPAPYLKPRVAAEVAQTEVKETAPVAVEKTTALAAATTPRPVEVKTVESVAVPSAPTPRTAAPRRATAQVFAAAEVVGRSCGETAEGLAIRCTAQNEDSADYIIKRLPAGVKVRKASGGFLTTTEPTLVRVAIKAPTQRVAPQPAQVQLAFAKDAPADTLPSHDQCSALRGNASLFMKSSNSAGLRCGPQAQHPAGYAQVARANEAQGLTGVVPVHARIPEGYKAVFTDGRLNPHRGPQTLEGDYQMAQVLSSTVPAYSAGYRMKRTFWQALFGLPGTWVPSNTGVQTAQVQTTQAVSAAPRVSTKSAPLGATVLAPSAKPKTFAATPAQPKAVSGVRYVQVGTFGVPQNATNSIARLASMGMPVSSQRMDRNGKQLKMVLAGPFATPEQTLQALSQARAAGYTDAFARK